ncbi:MAG: hypothetical protein IPJ87_14805 [Flavobacteriales bacterium]|nr:hypothetical protein [Flavobacteriales bacterium]MBK8947381.1 hypothetical protein [Flavobacteriales bacterium]
MAALQLQAEIQQLLSKEKKISVLEVIRIHLRQEESQEDDLTDEEVAELEERWARRLSGKSTGHSAEESNRRPRAAQAKDEAI